jgi:hypothetical protein
MLIFGIFLGLLYRWTRVHLHGGCRSQAPSHLHQERLQDRLLAFRSLLHYGCPLRRHRHSFQRPNAHAGPGDWRQVGRCIALCHCDDQHGHISSSSHRQRLDGDFDFQCRQHVHLLRHPQLVRISPGRSRTKSTTLLHQERCAALLLLRRHVLPLLVFHAAQQCF